MPVTNFRRPPVFCSDKCKVVGRGLPLPAYKRNKKCFETS